MAAKPSTLPRWATGGSALVTAPTEAKKDIGWIVQEKPPAQYLNWRDKLVYEWLAYLDDLRNHAFVWTQDHTFQLGITVTGASNTAAVSGFGNGIGAGIRGQGGATGAGGQFTGGGGNAPGVVAAASGTGPAVRCDTGGVHLNATQPVTSADPGANMLHATNLCKAWAYVTTNGSGGITVQDGYNIASATVGSGYIEVNFTRSMATVNYADSISLATQSLAWYRDPTFTTASKIRVSFTTGNPLTTVVRLSVIIFGRQS